MRGKRVEEHQQREILFPEIHGGDVDFIAEL
jgi:hypothetical protein